MSLILAGNVQNITSQSLFFVALFFRLCRRLSFDRYLVVAKHHATKYNASISNVINAYAIIIEINTKVASMSFIISSF